MDRILVYQRPLMNSRQISRDGHTLDGMALNMYLKIQLRSDFRYSQYATPI